MADPLRFRLNIEDELFSDPRFYKLAKRYGNDFKKTCGILVYLWKNSQREDVVIASKNKILDYLIEDDEKFVTDLCECGFLIAQEDKFFIVGNEKQLASAKKAYQQKVDAGTIGGKISAENRAKACLESNSGKQTPSEPQADSKQTPSEPQAEVKQKQPQEQIQLQKQKQDSEKESTSISDETDSPAIHKADKKSIGPKIPENVQRVIDLWNTHKPVNLAKVRAIDAARLRKIKARLAQFPEDADWIAAIKNISDSEFYSGKSGKGYKASFDFLLQENGLKAFEGPLEAERFDPKRKLKNNHQSTVDYSKMGITDEDLQNGF